MGGELQSEIRDLQARLGQMEQELGALDQMEVSIGSIIERLDDRIETEPLAEEQAALKARIETLLNEER